MKLKNYIKQNHIKTKELTNLFGVSQMTIWRWCEGTAIPRKEAMGKILEWTKGSVLPQDFYEAMAK